MGDDRNSDTMSSIIAQENGPFVTEQPGPRMTTMAAPSSSSSLPSSFPSHRQQNWAKPSFVQALWKREIILILFITFIFSISIFIVFGPISETMADRYARLRHGYKGNERCWARVSETATNKPLRECQAGADDARAAATASNVGLCIMGLVVNPLVASWTDTHGRKRALLASLAVNGLTSFTYYISTVNRNMNPVWYYASLSLTGGVQYMSLVFATLSDVVSSSSSSSSSTSSSFRTASLGIFLAVFYAGMAIAPSLPVMAAQSVRTDHSDIALFSTILMVINLLFAMFVLPETLSTENQQGNQLEQQRYQQADTRSSTTLLEHEQDCGNSVPCTRRIRYCGWRRGCCQATSSSLWLDGNNNLSILNRNWMLRLIAVGGVLSSMVYASDATLMIYYIEEYFSFDDADIARLFWCIGIFGVVVKGVLLQPLVQSLGESRVLVLTFASGAVHNSLYGLATTKRAIFAAVILSQLSTANLPVLATLASRFVPNVGEQGRLQGALAACTSLGAAVGPVSAEWIYHCTKHRHGYGPGFLFLYASALYVVGTALMALLPNNIGNLSCEEDILALTQEETTPRPRQTTDKSGRNTTTYGNENAGDLEEDILAPTQEQTTPRPTQTIDESGRNTTTYGNENAGDLEEPLLPKTKLPE